MIIIIDIIQIRFLLIFFFLTASNNCNPAMQNVAIEKTKINSTIGDT